MSEIKFTRRRMLQSLGLGAAGWVFRDVLFERDARADTRALPRILVFCYFSGGWDQLMALDPRPFAYDSPSEGYPNSNSPIDPAWDQIVDTTADVDSAGHTKAINYFVNGAGKNSRGLVELGSTGVMAGPALYDTVLATDPDVARSVCLVRGVNMGTLTHEVGRRYFLTGKFPRGLQASGSSLPTWVAYQNGADTGAPIPNLTVSVETYNEGLPAFSSGLVVNSSGDLVNVLKPLAPSTSGGVKDTPTAVKDLQRQAILDFESKNDCWEERLNGDGLVDALRAGRASARTMVERNLSALFSFSPTTSDPGLAALYPQFGIDTGSRFYTDVNGPKGQALIAAQAITPRDVAGNLVAVSTCVSIQLASGIDDHDSDWGQTHGQSLRGGFDALGRLIRYLQATDDALNPGHKLIERTQLMAFSEFARTPNINSRGGRDHHLASCCLLAGAGIKGGQALGGTRDSDFGVLPMSLATGSTQGGDWSVRPSDVHATFLKAAGLSYTHISNQQPRLITAALSNP